MTGVATAGTHRLSALAAGATQRFRLLGWAVVSAALGIAGLLLFALLIVGLPLLVVPRAGSVPATGIVRFVRRFADAHRWLVGIVVNESDSRRLGVVALDTALIRRALRQGTGGESWGVYPPLPDVGERGHGRILLRQRATWRDAAWLLGNGTLGVALSLLLVGLFVGSVHYLLSPLLFAIARAEQLRLSGDVTGHTVWGIGTVDGYAASWIGVPIGAAGLLLWWWLAPCLLRGYAALSRRLLGRDAVASVVAALRAPTPARADAGASASAGGADTGAGATGGADTGLGVPGDEGSGDEGAGDEGAGTHAVPTAPAARWSALTAREREVFALMAEGRTNAAIAARLFVTEKAVSKHINNVFRKLDLAESSEDNRRVLATLAYHRGGTRPTA